MIFIKLEEYDTFACVQLFCGQNDTQIGFAQHKDPLRKIEKYDQKRIFFNNVFFEFQLRPSEK